MRIKKNRLIEYLRIDKRSVAWLAGQLGCSRQYLGQVLSRQRKLSLKYSKRLIDLFGANAVAEMVDWESMKISNPFKGGVRESV